MNEESTSHGGNPTQPSFLEDCLNRKIIFFTGKGGVGKSTLAWATASLLAKNGRRVTLASWNPYAEDSEHPFWKDPSIRWFPLETLSAFKEYALQTLKFEKVYNVVFNNPVLKAFVKAAPGLAESVIAGKLWDLLDRQEQDTLIVDLPSSGHALSFFKSPLGLEKIFKVGFIHRDVNHIVEMFNDPATRIDLVTLPEEMPMVEVAELKTNLQTLHPFPFGFLHFNMMAPELELGKEEDWSEITGSAKQCYLQHIAHGKQEAKAKQWSEQKIQLPFSEIYRVPKEHEAEVIASVSQQLEAF